MLDTLSGIHRQGICNNTESGTEIDRQEIIGEGGGQGVLQTLTGGIRCIQCISLDRLIN